MDIENAKAQMKKGVLELCILSILNRQESYPGDIIEEMKASKIILVEGTLYPLLTRLKNAGILTYRWEESTSGPPRKYYKLTPEGEEFLQELLGAWQELVSAVKTVSVKKLN
ncbi:MAG TPA: PadR family transcriptional regulator [Flavobacteriales bacterium]|nr:PadR family transcriptional regulator [Flavobacteriales bacterium]HRE76040.1 PadR family transcriptional regulator [Flavobacteriales bacterium]HRJ35139.1 PadR family transcriptional regulator [Flavobacteriales bacterium]HRJ38609.1 PadR family transcriptional regulator [Flavobacteriales bacterium]